MDEAPLQGTNSVFRATQAAGLGYVESGPLGQRIVPDSQNGPGSGSSRVFRGGGWGCSADYCRCALRASSGPDFTISIVGFRLVRAIR